MLIPWLSNRKGATVLLTSSHQLLKGREAVCWTKEGKQFSMFVSLRLNYASGSDIPVIGYKSDLLVRMKMQERDVRPVRAETETNTERQREKERPDP
jgi:hypothetical protein